MIRKLSLIVPVVAARLMRWMRWMRLAGLALFAASGCASSTAATPEARTARDIATTDDRLQGSWRLVEFRPEAPSDPMFQALLTAQLGVAIVRFERGQLYADSPNFHVVRPYRITEAAGPLFVVESPDVGGAVFASSANISDDGQRIAFRGNTDPWRGSGTLVRVR